MNKSDIMSFDIDELCEQVALIGEKSFRAKQIYEWLHVKLVESFDDMTNLSKSLRDTLDEKFVINMPKIVEVYKSKIDGTRKYLFELFDGSIIESVLMKYKHGNSVCISSQVGCRMGCKFCASTLDGLERNLLPSEMIGQVYAIQKDLGERISNIVIMGSGEPFDNFVKFIKLITSEKGLNISSRNITVSTCGLVDKIRELADMKQQITLAISLHATTDEVRKTIMPIANKYKISQILEACKYYFNITGRRITFEYSLIEGVNDSEKSAMELIILVKGINCHINLIPVNPIKVRNYRHSSLEYINKFQNILEKNGINATIRREMGADINAACGQLRRSYIDKYNK